MSGYERYKEIKGKIYQDIERFSKAERLEDDPKNGKN